MLFVEKTFDQLSVREFHDVMQLRLAVFAVEQKCVYQDLDCHDPEATHLLGLLDGRIEAYSRWYPVPEGIHLGRIVTSPSVRGQGFGRRIVAEALRRIGSRPVVIQAQAQLENFYAEAGFVRTGPDFILDGIPHLPMARGLPGALGR
jgi:ElaA protein